MSYLVVAATVPIAAFLARHRLDRFGAFLAGLALVVFFDFLGAFVIGPGTYSDSQVSGAGGVLGTIGGGLLGAAGVASLTAARGSAQEDAAATACRT
jgi:hypothetical protein